MSSPTSSPPLSSFSSRRLNPSTFLIVETDSYGEHPFIYAKVHPSAPLLILTDTGCDSPAPELVEARYVHLREYLEFCPLACNNGRPLNPAGERWYAIICTHCHYDHILGIPQFVPGAEIIASTYGRDFIESDLGKHGLFDGLGIPVPGYTVTKWAQAFENLTIQHDGTAVQLGVTSMLTPGHTPDSLSCYDREEHWLYVGDLLYEEGEDKTAAILFTPQGNVVEWMYSLEKLLRFVKTENQRLAAADEETPADAGEEDWIVLRPGSVKLAAGHVTCAGDAEELLGEAIRFMHDVLRGRIPVIQEGQHLDEQYQVWREDGRGMFLSAPVRLINAARKFFGEGCELI